MAGFAGLNCFTSGNAVEKAQESGKNAWQPKQQNKNEFENISKAETDWFPLFVSKIATLDHN